MKKFSLGGKEYEISLKKKHIKQGWSHLRKVYKEGEEDIDQLVVFLDWIDNLACDLLGVSEDAFGEFDSDEASQVTGWIQDEIKNAVGFLKP